MVALPNGLVQSGNLQYCCQTCFLHSWCVDPRSCCALALNPDLWGVHHAGNEHRYFCNCLLSVDSHTHATLGVLPFRQEAVLFCPLPRVCQCCLQLMNRASSTSFILHSPYSGFLHAVGMWHSPLSSVHSKALCDHIYLAHQVCIRLCLSQLCP